MAMRIVEPRQNGLPGEVDFLGSNGRQIQDIPVAAHRQEAAAGDSDGLCARLGPIDREDIPIEQNQLRLFSFERKGR
jgi:hypothetical protein